MREREREKTTRPSCFPLLFFVAVFVPLAPHNPFNTKTSFHKRNEVSRIVLIGTLSCKLLGTEKDLFVFLYHNCFGLPPFSHMGTFPLLSTPLGLGRGKGDWGPGTGLSWADFGCTAFFLTWRMMRCWWWWFWGGVKKRKHGNFMYGMLACIEEIMIDTMWGGGGKKKKDGEELCLLLCSINHV